MADPILYAPIRSEKDPVPPCPKCESVDSLRWEKWECQHFDGQSSFGGVLRCRCGGFVEVTDNRVSGIGWERVGPVLSRWGRL